MSEKVFSFDFELKPGYTSTDVLLYLLIENLAATEILIRTVKTISTKTDKQTIEKVFAGIDNALVAQRADVLASVVSKFGR